MGKISRTLDKALVRMMMSEPVFSRIVRSLRKQSSDQVPTAGVRVQNGRFELLVNDDFFSKLTLSQQVGLMKHECFHLLLEHCTSRTRPDNHQVWNIAADLAINTMISEKELPPGGLFPGRLGGEGPLSELISKLPEDKSAEWYYSQIMKDPEAKEQASDCSGGASCGGKSLADALKDGDVKIDENGNLVDKNGNPVSVQPGPMDDHGSWGEASASETAEAEANLREAVKAAAREAMKTNSWGSGSCPGFKKIVERFVDTSVDWRDLLSDQIGSAQPSDRYNTHRRINKKYPMIHPGSRRRRRPSIVLYIDQSGSVGDADLALLFAEIENLAEHASFTCFSFDTCVIEDSRQDFVKGEAVEIDRTTCGGTSFQCCINHYDESSEFEAMFILTDGYAPIPSESLLGVEPTWIITPDGDRNFDSKVSHVVVQMENED